MSPFAVALPLCGSLLVATAVAAACLFWFRRRPATAHSARETKVHAPRDESLPYAVVTASAAFHEHLWRADPVATSRELQAWHALVVGLALDHRGYVWDDRRSAERVLTFARAADAVSFAVALQLQSQALPDGDAVCRVYTSLLGTEMPQWPGLRLAVAITHGHGRIENTSGAVHYKGPIVAACAELHRLTPTGCILATRDANAAAGGDTDHRFTVIDAPAALDAAAGSAAPLCLIVPVGAEYRELVLPGDPKAVPAEPAVVDVDREHQTRIAQLVVEAQCIAAAPEVLLLLFDTLKALVAPLSPADRTAHLCSLVTAWCAEELRVPRRESLTTSVAALPVEDLLLMRLAGRLLRHVLFSRHGRSVADGPWDVLLAVTDGPPSRRTSRPLETPETAPAPPPRASRLSLPVLPLSPVSEDTPVAPAPIPAGALSLSGRVPTVPGPASGRAQ